MGADRPTVSVVIPALDEAEYLPETLTSLANQRFEKPFEVIVVDGGSTDETPSIVRESDARLIRQSGTGIGAGRHEGAMRARGEWLAFVDADTRPVPSYLAEMHEFVEREGLDAASSRCRVVGSHRGKAKQLVVNRLFPRLGRPILPGFNVFVDATVYRASGGFPNVPNEDTAFSRALAREYDVGYHPELLVETSGRRFRRSGLTGALYHYVRLDVGRLRARN